MKHYFTIYLQLSIKPRRIGRAMKVRHASAEFGRLESDPDFTAGYARAVVHGFRKVLNLVRLEPNETGLRKWRSLKFEKLKGSRAHQWSLRINDQYRVIVEIDSGEGSNNNTLVVVGIEDYH